MKSKIFIVKPCELEEAIVFVKQEAAKLGSYRYIDSSAALYITKKKYAYYANEVESHVKALVIETTPSFPYSEFFCITRYAGEIFNKITVNRPYLPVLELNVTLFFLSTELPKEAGCASFDARFDVVQYQKKQIGSVTNRLFGVNTVLHTKDGRKIGNAIIVGKDNKYNIIKTDYGNKCKFTDDEIKECFHIAYSDLTDEEIQYMRETIGDHKHSV